MSWLNPNFAWALIGVPVAFALIVWAAVWRRRAYTKLGDLALVKRLFNTISARRRRWKGAFFVAGVLLVAVSLMGPRFGTKIKEVKREGVDLVIALDVSLSMRADDVAPDRLERAKNEIKKLLQQLRGDRVGLVLFAGDAFIQCPLTTDYGAVRLFLDVANPSQIPTPGTDFGRALQMAMRAFETGDDPVSEDPTRALLFVSDGENHVESLPTIIQEAKDAGIVMFSAGVGETDGVPIPVSRSGRTVRYKKDRRGEIVMTKLEEDVLQELAQEGAYFRIARTSSSLHKISDALDRLEKHEFGSEEFEEYEEKYQWPLALGLILLFTEIVVSDRRRKPGASLAAGINDNESQ